MNAISRIVRPAPLAALTLLTLLSGGAAHAQLFVSSYTASSSVTEYTESGTFVRTFIAAGSGGLSLTGNIRFGPDGNLYATSNASGIGSVKKYDGTTGAYLGNVITGLGIAYDVIFDGSGLMYVTDYNAAAVYKINPTTGAILQTYTGGLSGPEGVSLLPNGNIVAGSGTGANPVVFNNATGVGTTFATGIGVNVGNVVGPDGRVYFTGYSSNVISVVPATGGAATTFSTGGTLNHPQYITYDNGSFFVGSLNNNTVQYFNATTGAFQGSFTASSATGIAVRGAAAPEPGTLGLGLLALGGVVVARRRRGMVSAIIRRRILFAG